MELPTKKSNPESLSPNRLIIYSPPKMGKTTALSELPDNLIIDLEKGSKFVSAIKVEANNMSEIKDILKSLKEEIKENEGKIVRKYITIDTVTKLEEICLPLALDLYRDTPMGKNFGMNKKTKKLEYKNVLTLPNGGGYLYLREAFKKIIDAFQNCCERLILVGHLKDKMTSVDGKEVSTKDLDLTGKVSNITCANADAIGYLYRDKETVKLNFQSSQDITCGARPKHLRGKEINLFEDGEYHWDRIFID